MKCPFCHQGALHYMTTASKSAFYYQACMTHWAQIKDGLFFHVPHHQSPPDKIWWDGMAKCQLTGQPRELWDPGGDIRTVVFFLPGP